ncbi:CBL-interacting serine threonine- kinase 14-like [Olea europaea subsp. europaea]|uniref:non-specific serine/threonine protein kinase n=2 Tax=Olea europaea subsp. europaea TaxID=158383 RepID=A0A8S0U628_OLEEU|nr:CBL-interacting serine threonine- kinase 14-like [Olea europaea subsp. europaea]
MNILKRYLHQVMPDIVHEKLNLLPPAAAAGDSGGGEEASVVLFNKYELGQLLGYGAFAKVYHARDVRTGPSVAIKVVDKEWILKENLKENVIREISIMRWLHHPHIVHLHEVLATKTRIYYVMEYAKEGALFKKIVKGGFSEDVSRKYFQQLISAVDHCHSRGVFHRDLKLENLLLDENLELKVTDFGLSALTNQIRPDGQLHTSCGTPAYMAPEILAKRGYDGAKVDIWSCGVVLYVLSTGYLPFRDPNLVVMYMKIYKGQFRCPKWNSADLNRLLVRMLDPNPTTRITVNEIRQDPWFRNGYKKTKYPVDEGFGFKKSGGDMQDSSFLNAFDIISYSSGFDLSGLFSHNGIHITSEMFISAESPRKIIEKIEEVAKEGGMRVMKKEKGIRLLGNFVVMVEINQLTEELVMVEVKRRGLGRDIWKEKFKPQLRALIYQSERLDRR